MKFNKIYSALVAFTMATIANGAPTHKVLGRRDMSKTKKLNIIFWSLFAVIVLGIIGYIYGKIIYGRRRRAARFAEEARLRNLTSSSRNAPPARAHREGGYGGLGYGGGQF